LVHLSDQRVFHVELDHGCQLEKLGEELELPDGELIQSGSSVFVVDTDNITKITRAEIDFGFEDNDFGFDSVIGKPMSSYNTVFQNSDEFD